MEMETEGASTAAGRLAEDSSGFVVNMFRHCFLCVNEICIEKENSVRELAVTRFKRPSSHYFQSSSTNANNSSNSNTLVDLNLGEIELPHIKETLLIPPRYLKVGLCDRCEHLNETFSELLQTMEKQQVAMTASLKEIHQEIFKSHALGLGSPTIRRVMAKTRASSEIQSGANLTIVEQLRKELMSRCTTKLNELFPGEEFQDPLIPNVKTEVVEERVNSFVPVAAPSSTKTNVETRFRHKRLGKTRKDLGPIMQNGGFMLDLDTSECFLCVRKVEQNSSSSLHPISNYLNLNKAKVFHKLISSPVWKNYDEINLKVQLCKSCNALYAKFLAAYQQREDLISELAACLDEIHEEMTNEERKERYEVLWSVAGMSGYLYILRSVHTGKLVGDAVIEYIGKLKTFIPGLSPKPALPPLVIMSASEYETLFQQQQQQDGQMQSLEDANDPESIQASTSSSPTQPYHSSLVAPLTTSSGQLQANLIDLTDKSRENLATIQGTEEAAIATCEEGMDLGTSEEDKQPQPNSEESDSMAEPVVQGNQCPFCEKVLSMKYLSTHIRRMHKNVRYSCDQCDKSYSRNHYLQIHRDNDHFGGSRFQCKKCQKKFLSLPALRMHMSRKTSCI